MQKILWLWLILFSSGVGAQNLGQFGKLFPIVEEDALLWITQKRLPELVASGSVEKLEKKLKEKAQKQIQSPPGVRLPRTQQPKKRLLDLTVTAPHDFTDPQGRILIPKGTTSNPLEFLPTSHKQMLFVDGHDREQMAWAIQQWQKAPIETRIVLVDGAIERLTEEHDLRLYFDQHGKLIEHFGIAHVPAVVKRHADKLLIKEIVI